MPAAGFAIDLLPGRGLAARASRSPALGRNVRDRVRHRGRVRPGVRARAAGCRPRVVVGFGGYASLPALVAAPAPADPGRRARAGRGTRASRTASRSASAPAPRSRSRARRCRARWSPATRSGPRSPRCERAPVDARRSSRSSAGASGPARINARRSASTTAGATAPTSSIHHVSGARDYEECRDAARRRCARRATRWRTGWSATRTTWTTLLRRAPRSWCAARAG